MPRVLYFAQARDVAGRASDDVPGETVAEVLAHVIGRCGPAFEDVLSMSRIWVNGEPAEKHCVVGALDEVAILPPVSGGSDPTTLSLADLRTTRNDLQQREDSVSYVRRMVQGRLDIARAERERRAENRGGDIDVSGEITRVFAAESAGGSQRPPRDTEPSIDDPLVAQLDALCDRVGFGSVHGLDDDELTVCIDELSSFEAEVSRQRRELFAAIDALSAELVKRYKTHDSAVDELLDD